jgi:hypothetical protein
MNEYRRIAGVTPGLYPSRLVQVLLSLRNREEYETNKGNPSLVWRQNVSGGRDSASIDFISSGAEGFTAT